MKNCSHADQLGCRALRLRFCSPLAQRLAYVRHLCLHCSFCLHQQFKERLLWRHGAGEPAAVLGELAQTLRACARALPRSVAVSLSLETQRL